MHNDIALQNTLEQCSQTATLHVATLLTQDAGVIIIFQKSSDKCQINLMTCQSANLPPLVFTCLHYNVLWPHLKARNN